MEMTKSIGQVLYEAYKSELQTFGTAQTEWSWEQLSEETQQSWRVAAKAAIVENYLRQLDD